MFVDDSRITKNKAYSYCRRAEDCLDLLKNGDSSALGGCVIALIRQEASDDLVKKLSASGYRSFACQPSDGSRVEFMDALKIEGSL